jgi:iron complex outermembrane receptor protein
MNYRKTMLAASIITDLCLSGAVFAQDTGSQGTDDTTTSAAQKRAAEIKDLSTVTVTGIRASQENALNLKQAADSHIDVVTAEDVGKLPAHNVADALQGLPGVNISSSSADEGGFDEADRVSLRGTSPSLTQTLIDGHAVASADWFVLSQGGNMGRSVSYSLLPSELVGRVEVNKSSQAKLMDGGTSGNIDIITRKPLDFDKPITVNASIGAVNSDQADATDPQLSGLFNYKNADGTFGVLVQAFKQKRHLRREAQEIPGGFFKIAANAPVVATNPDLAGVYAPGLVGSTLFEQVRARKGGLVSVQFRPSDSLTLGLNGFLSEMKANNYNRNYMLWGSGFASSQAPDAGYVVKDGVLTNATYTGVAGTPYAIYDMIYREASAKSNYVTFDADWKITNSLSGRFQLGTTNGKGETARQYIAEVTSGIGGGASWSTHGAGSPVDWSVGGDTGPAATGFGTWGNQQVTAKDKENFGSVDFTQYLDGDVLSSVDFGARYANHTRKALSPEGASPGNIAAALENGAVGHYPGGFADTIGGNFPRDIWFYTPGTLKEAIDNNSTWLSDNDGPTGRHNYGAEFKVNEKNAAIYVQANLIGDGWSGNFGLRYVDIDQNIDTYQAVAAGSPNTEVSSLFGQWMRVHQENEIKRLLPSANLKFDIAQDLALRLAASQTQTLPDYSALGASSWGSDLNKVGGGGNTTLKPVLSTNFDANLEWYFMPRGLLSGGVYAMNLKDYVTYGTSTQMLFSELTHQLEAYQVSSPVNADGQVRGVELAYQQPIGDYFGVNANYTYAHARSAGGKDLIGTSKNSYNVGAYFENDAFAARVSYSYRSAFLIALNANGPYYQDDFGTLSASLSYSPTDWMSVSLDALNLNNPTIKYYQSSVLPQSFYANGRQYYVNFRFKY